MIFNVSVLTNNELKNYTASGETNEEIANKVLKTFKNVEYINIKRKTNWKEWIIIKFKALLRKVVFNTNTDNIIRNKDKNKYCTWFKCNCRSNELLELRKLDAITNNDSTYDCDLVCNKCEYLKIIN